MSFTLRILPVAVFGLSVVVTLFFRKTPALSATVQAEVAEKIPEVGITKRQRDETDFAAVRALLREGGISAAQQLLRELAIKDPVVFLKLLAKLPGFPGINASIREAAGRLTWNDPAVIEMLNRISSDDWRDLAWAAYLSPHVGVLQDKEVFAVGIQAEENRYLAVMGDLFSDAAEKRPDAFLDLLNSSKSTSLRPGFFEELMKFHPERVPELFDAIPDGSYGSGYDKAYILDARMRALPTAENLKEGLLERGERAIYDVTAASDLVSTAYTKASSTEKTKILDYIASQPPIARNRMLGGIAFSTMFQYNDPIAPAEFSKILNIYTSGDMQEKALDSWLKRNKELVSKDPGWIETLPSERLKNYVRKTNVKPESVPKP